MNQKIETVTSPSGRAQIATDGEKIISVSLWIEGKLQSYRDKDLWARSGIARDEKVKKAGATWLAKILALGGQHPLRLLQKQCGLDGICIHVISEASRKVPIRDFKDLIAGFDHMILDPLVHGGILIDDDMENIGRPDVDQVIYRYKEETLFLKFERSSRPCRESITRQILEFGWPDPEFRTRNKTQRRREIKQKMNRSLAI